MNKIKSIIYSFFIFLNLSIFAQEMHTVVDVYDIFIPDWIPADYSAITLEDGSEWRFDYETGRNIDIQINDIIQIFPLDVDEAVMFLPRTEAEYYFIKRFDAYPYPPEHEYWWNDFPVGTIK
jgi:hypothetical protein